MRPGGKSELDGCAVFRARGPFLEHARPRVWLGVASLLCRHHTMPSGDWAVNHVIDTNPSPHTQLCLMPSKQEELGPHTLRAPQHR